MATIPDFIWNFMVGSEGRTLDLTRSDSGNWTGGKVGVGELKGSKYGVSAARYPTLDIANLTEDDAKAIFDRDYFTKFGCDRIPPGLGLLVSDAAYNGGDPIRWMQRAVGAGVDGDFGDETKDYANAAMAADPCSVLATFQTWHLAYLTSLDAWEIDGEQHGAPEGWSVRLMKGLALAVQVSVAPQSTPSVN